MGFVKTKIDETYNVALKLGIKNASEMEKDIFKNMLYQIAVAANDETRHEIGETLHVQSGKYT